MEYWTNACREKRRVKELMRDPAPEMAKEWAPLKKDGANSTGIAIFCKMGQSEKQKEREREDSFVKDFFGKIFSPVFILFVNGP